MTAKLCLLVLIGCQSASAVTDPPQPPTGLPTPREPPTVSPRDDIAIRFHMYRNYDLLRSIERLLVRGNLADARALARSIAEAPEPLGFEPWAREAATIRDRASAVASSSRVDDALRMTAQLAGACASCHTSTGADVRFATPPAAPHDERTVPARMARHRWAVDRLWEGMVGNADEPWRAGLDVLVQTPLPFSAIGGDRIALAQRLQELATTARKAMTTSSALDRSHAYGEMLVVCAACHSGSSTTPKAVPTL